MKFDQLKANGFLSLGEVTLNFLPGLVLIEGVNDDEPYFSSNGSGKTALVESLVWALYGDTIRPAKVKEIVGWHADRCTVKVTMELGGKKVEVTRTRRSGSTLEIAINGKVLEGHTVQQTEKWLHDFLGVSKDRFMQTVVLESGLRGRFSELTDMTRKEVVEDLIGSSIWETAYRNSLSALREATSDLDLFRQKIQHTKDMGTTIRLHRKELLSTQDQDDFDSGDIEEQIKKVEVELGEQRTKLVAAKEAFKVATERKDTLAVMLKETEQGLEEAQKGLRGLEQTLAVTSADVDRYRTLIERGECPTCNQPTDGDVYKETLEHLLEEQTEQKAERDRVVTVVQDLEKRHRTDNEEYLVQAGRSADANSGMNAAENRIEFLLDKIERLQTPVVPADNKIEELLAQADKRLEDLKTELMEMLEDLRIKENRVAALQYWKSAFPVIRTEALESVLAFLNQRLRYYGAVLSDSAEVVQVELEKERLKLSTQLPGKTVGHQVRSSGERRRVDLAIQFALSDLAASLSPHGHPSLLILDEVLDTLDPLATRRVLTLLEELSETRTIWVTTHSSDVREALGPSGSVLVIRKAEGVSSLEPSSFDGL
jgi:DNA repair exonuclease SbcCD ATPase subunit